MSDLNLSSRLHAVFRELIEIGIKGAEEAESRCFVVAYTTSTEWYGEAGLAIIDLLRSEWKAIPPPSRAVLLNFLRHIASIWPGFFWVWLRFKLRQLTGY